MPSLALLNLNKINYTSQRKMKNQNSNIVAPTEVFKWILEYYISQRDGRPAPALPPILSVTLSCHFPFLDLISPFVKQGGGSGLNNRGSPGFSHKFIVFTLSATSVNYPNDLSMLLFSLYRERSRDPRLSQEAETTLQAPRHQEAAWTGL